MIHCDTFNVDIEQLFPGCEKVTLRFGQDIEILFYASYVGQEPLNSMLDSLYEFECGYEHDDDDDDDESRLKYVWYDEPGTISFDVTKRSSTLLMHICNDKEEDGINVEQWHICLPYEVYKQGIIDAALLALKRCGCKGFNSNWSDGTNGIFIGKLISVLTSKSKIYDADNNCRSDIKEELQTLMDLLQ